MLLLFTEGNETYFITNLFGLQLGDQFTDIRVLNAMDTSLHLVRQWLEKDNDNLHGESILNKLKARKSYMVGLAYLSLPRCSQFVQAKVEFSHVIELLKSAEPSSIQNTLNTDSAEILGVFDPKYQ
ncbi:hypothetical protein BDF14DRAFT_1515425 [Spinellus fusiger]|nr:hypothetical protein BDF14DRAFT_1515425 [Spinellus fusiger]